jgi:hypothetical protein
MQTHPLSLSLSLSLSPLHNALTVKSVGDLKRPRDPGETKTSFKPRSNRKDKQKATQKNCVVHFPFVDRKLEGNSRLRLWWSFVYQNLLKSPFCFRSFEDAKNTLCSQLLQRYRPSPSLSLSLSLSRLTRTTAKNRHTHPKSNSESFEFLRFALVSDN